jgi:hypothetical protein
MSYWWMSFVDKNKPKGSKFLGALIIKAENKYDVLVKSWTLGLNPGGDVQFYKIPEEYESRIPAEWIETRILNKEEIDAFERKWLQ